MKLDSFGKKFLALFCKSRNKESEVETSRMYGLKGTSNLMFFEENWGSHNTDTKQFVGLIKSKNYPTEELLRKIKRERIRSSSFIYADDVQVLAGARIGRENGVLYVENIGAVDGYGPTLYASIFQMAFEDGYEGISPTRNLGEITERASQIWQRFSTDYGRLISLSARTGPPHRDIWLNKVFSLKSPLIDLQGMRRRYSFYSMANPRSSPRSQVFDVASRSVDEHRSVKEAH